MGRQWSLCIPVVSPQASKLFSVTQILIWKSQLTELTEDRRKKKERGAAKIYCPSSTVLFLEASSAIRLMALDGRQLLILISCLFHTGCAERWEMTGRPMSLLLAKEEKQKVLLEPAWHNLLLKCVYTSRNWNFHDMTYNIIYNYFEQNMYTCFSSPGSTKYEYLSSLRSNVGS